MKLLQFRLAMFLLGLGILTSCSFPVISIDDFSDVMQGKETAVHSVLEIKESGEVVVEGEVLSVSGLGSDCSVSDGQCYFSMKVDGVIVFIHYLFNLDLDQPECLNFVASEQGLKVRSGDHIKLFGEYFGAGNISVCGSQDYYIEILPSESLEP
jgi:hypothetical protein